jgi:hypothetical protein
MGKENDMSVKMDNQFNTGGTGSVKDTNNEINNVQGELEKYGFDPQKMDQWQSDLQSGDSRKKGNAINDIASDVNDVLNGEKPGTSDSTDVKDEAPTDTQNGGTDGKEQTGQTDGKEGNGEKISLEDIVRLLAQLLGLDEQQTNKLLQKVGELQGKSTGTNKSEGT